MNDQELLLKLRAAFAEESAERLAAINAMMLDLEKAGLLVFDQGLLEKVFREFHSLKGAARAVNFFEIETICQALESIFSGLKSGEKRLTPPLFDSMLEAVDLIESILAEPERSQKSVGQGQVLSMLRRLEGRGTASKAPPVMTPGVAPSPPSAAVVPPATIAAGTDLGPEAPPPGPGRLPSEENGPAQEEGAPLPPLPAVSPLGHGEERRQARVRVISDKHIRVDTAKLGSLLLKSEEMIALKLTGSRHMQDLKQVGQTVDLWRERWNRTDKPLRQLRKSAAAINAGQQGAAPGYSTEIWHFLEWANDFVATLGQDIKALTRIQDQHQRALTRMVDDLLDEAKSVVMQPCSTLLALFPKMVREIAKQQKKEIDLQIHGGAIEVDRRILERMKDPLVHLLRNAVDHGIEYPDERLARGKAARGIIAVTISQIEGGKIEILVSDDGNGLDLDRIKDSAIAKQVLSREEASAIEARQAAALIFTSGVSAAPIVTELSGRGLGMAIVQEAVEELAGVLSLDNRPGKGLRLAMRLPVSMSTFRGVLVQAGAELFILPSAQVVAVLKLKKEEVKTVENRNTILYKGKPLSLVGLGEVLGLSDCRLKAGDSLKVAVLASGAWRMGFTVDEVIEELEVLVKDLGKQVRRVVNLAGCTVLGSGRVVPVINVRDLLRSATKGSSGQAGAMDGAQQEAVKRRSILVVEDSITSRTLLKNILEMAGYQVTTAVDGQDGLTFLKSSEVDLVVTDIEMPRMNGLELTIAIRHDPRLADLPVILVTTLSSREDRERGIDAGANAYIVKSSFDQSNLLEVIGRFL